MLRTLTLAVVAPLAVLLAGRSQAQVPEGWTIDTTLKTFSGTVCAAADGDVVIASRSFRDEEAAIEVHRYDAALDRHVLEATLRDPSWLPPHWLGLSASVEAGVAAVYSRATFATTGVVHVLERTGGAWGMQNVALPVGSTGLFGRNIDVSDGRVVAATGNVFQPLALHFLEPDAAGRWDVAQSLRLTLRALYPPENPGYLALDGDLAAITSSASFPLAHFALCVRDAATGRWTEERLIALPDARLAPGGVAVEGGLVVLGGARRSSADPFVSVAWILERTPSGGLVRRQEIRRPGATPYYESNVMLQGGRLLLAAEQGVHVFERDASGTFVEVAHYRGLGDPVNLLAGAAPGSAQGTGPGRVVGRDGRTVRVAPFPPPQVPGGPAPTFDVRQDLGVATCHPSAAGAPTLRFYGYASIFLSGVPRRAVTIEDAAPGATVLVFASLLPGSSPALGGALCLDRSSLVLAIPPASVGAAGELLLDLTASPLPVPTGLGDGYHLQALVLDPAGARLTNAVHFVQ